MFKLITILIILCTTIIISADNIELFVIERKIQSYYNDWNEDWDCSDTSVECEKYFETHGYTCYLVYGDRGLGTDEWIGHMWNIVIIDGKPYEFESTTLHFMKVSDKYNIQTIQEGFYVNGIKYNKSQPMEEYY